MHLPELPIDDVLPQIIAALRDARLRRAARSDGGRQDDARSPLPCSMPGLAGNGQIVLLQPRRIAARAAAWRMAEERGTPLGEEIGYQVRFERKASRQTRILAFTEGCSCGCCRTIRCWNASALVMFDEFHERTLDADLALAIARRLQAEVRPELKMLVMSATLDPAPIARFLGDCPQIESAGRLHPVAISYLRHDDRSPIHAAAWPTACGRCLRKPRATCWRFCPASARFAARAGELAIAGRCETNLVDHGTLRRFAAGAPAGRAWPRDRRKIVLATNVAETSLTIEGDHRPWSILDWRGSIASIRRWAQSAGHLPHLAGIGRSTRGRAGRTAPGVCLRLWTEATQRALAEHELPEIARVDLAGAVLELALLGRNRPGRAFRGSNRRRRNAGPRTGAAAATGRDSTNRGLTRIGPPHGPLAGRAAHRPPVVRRAETGARPADRPRRRAAVRARSVCPANRAAAREPPRGIGRIPTSLDRWRRWKNSKAPRKSVRRECGNSTSMPDAARFNSSRARDQFSAQCDLIARQHPPRRRRRHAKPSTPTKPCGGRSWLRSPIAWLGGAMRTRAGLSWSAGAACGCMNRARCAKRSCSSASISRSSARLNRWCGRLRPSSANGCPAESLTTAVDVEYDAERKRIVAFRRTRYLDLVLDEAATNVPADFDAAPLLAEAAASNSTRISARTRPGLQYLARVRSLARWMPELELPDFGDDPIRAVIARNVPRLPLAGRSAPSPRSRRPFNDCSRRGKSRPSPAKRRSDCRSPAAARSHWFMKLAQPPVLAVRIQEVFGMQETPRVAAGRVPVLMHLLAPNMRPQQITSDLKSFWQTTYAEVRKELRRRYPKHAWPEDPRTASPQRRPGKKRTPN